MRKSVLIFAILAGFLAYCFSGALPSNNKIKSDVSLNTDKTANSRTVRLKLGQISSYKAEVFYSAGYSIFYKIKNPKILRFMSKKYKYLNNLHGRPGIVGADRAVTTLYFKAINYGRTEISFFHVARGRIIRKVIITVFVE